MLIPFFNIKNHLSPGSVEINGMFITKPSRRHQNLDSDINVTIYHCSLYSNYIIINISFNPKSLRNN